MKCLARRAEMRGPARLSCAMGSVAIVAYVCIATGSAATSLAIYILSVAAAALTLRRMGWYLVPALPRSVANARAWVGRRVRHGFPGIRDSSQGHGG